MGNNINTLEVYVLKYFSEEQEAYKYEEELTKFLKGIGHCRCNRNVGAKQVVETKRKLSELNKGSKKPMYGKAFSNEHKKKLSDSRKGEKNHLYGKSGAVHSSSKPIEAVFPDGSSIQSSSKKELADKIKIGMV